MNTLVGVAAAILVGLAILRSYAVLTGLRARFRATFGELGRALGRRHDAARRLLEALPDAPGAGAARAGAALALRLAEVDPFDAEALAGLVSGESALSRALAPALADADRRGGEPAELAEELLAADRSAAVATHVANGAAIAYSSVLRRPPHALVAPLFRFRSVGPLEFELQGGPRA